MIKKAVVISLKDSDRMTGFWASCWGNTQFEIFEAVDTRYGFVPDDYNLADFQRRYNRMPRPGEIGCAMSHYEVIKAFALEEGAPDDLLLVAEDDARATEGFGEILYNIVASKQPKELVILSEPIFGSSKNMKYYALSLAAEKVGRGRRFGNYIDKVAGNGLYLISRSTCQGFIKQVQKAGGVSWVADDYLTFENSQGMINPFEKVDIRVVRPGLADWEGESTIQEPEGYERYRQRKLAEHSAGSKSILFYISKFSSKLNRENLGHLKNLLLVSLRDYMRILGKK